MNQEYYFNKEAAVYNCNVCGDVQIRMTGDGEQPPEEGCYNPYCPSNEGKTPPVGLELKYVEYNKGEA